MIPVGMTGEGPDLEEVKQLVETDDSIRGIWCVPKYSNPTGEVYSLEVTKGLLDIFGQSKYKSVIFWDNAYAVHDLSDQTPLPDILVSQKQEGLKI
jgi:DNA-binding transcriptional MocR family regulator